MAPLRAGHIPHLSGFGPSAPRLGSRFTRDTTTLSGVRLLSRIRLTTWLLLAWTALAAGVTYWGYRSVMASCPPPEDFSGCFEPPYRFSAGVFFTFWATVEVVLVVAWLLERWTARGPSPPR
jgi:hypothetical protein